VYRKTWPKSKLRCALEVALKKAPVHLMALEKNPVVLESAVALRCMNCESPLGGYFCAHCGQEAMIETPTVDEFVREFLQDQMALEGKLLRTLRVLVGKPGQLTLDYIDGRRQRYIRPLRLYLTLSVVYFAVSGLTGSDAATSSKHKPDKPAATAAINAASSKNKAATAAKHSDADASKDSAPEPDADSDDKNDDEDVDDNLPPKAAQSTLAQTALAASLPAAHDAKNSAHSKDNAAQPKADKRDQTPADTKTSAGFKWDHSDGVDSPDYDQLRDFKTGYGALDARIQRFFDRPQSRALNDFQNALKNDAPIAVFFVLPLFAALLQIGYLRHHLRYGAHVLFSLHFHAFVFFDLLLANLASLTPLHSFDSLLIIAIPMYLLFALRRVYGGGNWSTGFWVFCMLILHAIFIGIALFLAAIVSVAING
jgi:hypothetical protein